MSHEKRLLSYIEDLVRHYAEYACDQYELTLDMLPESQQNELVRLYIESIDREIEWACYGSDESINSDFLCSMLGMLKNNNHETRALFAETTQRNLLIFYKKTLGSLLTEGCETYLQNQMNEKDYHADYESGDVVWGKF